MKRILCLLIVSIAAGCVLMEPSTPINHEYANATPVERQCASEAVRANNQLASYADCLQRAEFNATYGVN